MHVIYLFHVFIRVYLTVKLVLGCGSNVVDHIYRVKGIHLTSNAHCMSVLTMLCSQLSLRLEQKDFSPGRPDCTFKIKAPSKVDASFAELCAVFSPFRALEKRLIGGVTLNHLCWAALGGVPTGLLALQGKDELGRLIRTNLRDLGVATDYITS